MINNKEYVEMSDRIKKTKSSSKLNILRDVERKMDELWRHKLEMGMPEYAQNRDILLMQENFAFAALDDLERLAYEEVKAYVRYKKLGEVIKNRELKELFTRISSEKYRHFNELIEAMNILSVFKFFIKIG